jgi:hypothetical protein
MSDPEVEAEILDDAFAEVSEDAITITGIHLMRHSEHVCVSVEIGGKWVEVIRERHDGSFSHIVEPSGMRKAALMAGLVII